MLRVIYRFASAGLAAGLVAALAMGAAAHAQDTELSLNARLLESPPSVQYDKRNIYGFFLQPSSDIPVNVDGDCPIALPGESPKNSVP